MAVSSTVLIIHLPSGYLRDKGTISYKTGYLQTPRDYPDVSKTKIEARQHKASVMPDHYSAAI
jgi:hypothetical protein